MAARCARADCDEGIAIGWFSLRLRSWAHDPRVEITLSLMTPYAAFLLPAHWGVGPFWRRWPPA